MGNKMSRILEKLFMQESCCDGGNEKITGLNKIILVGSPNVGKSVIFNNLTGRYVTVSNYPGTTVEVSRGKAKICDTWYEIIDTPGMYSLRSITDEERVGREILLTEKTALVLHIVDAKNLERMLPLTLQLLETGLPVILVLNIMDEAERLGIKIDVKFLERELGIPVIPTVSISGKGMTELREAIKGYDRRVKFSFQYDGVLEKSLNEIETLLKADYDVSKRTIAALLLQEDQAIIQIAQANREDLVKIQKTVSACREKYYRSLNFTMAVTRQHIADRLSAGAKKEKSGVREGFAETLSRIMMNPWSGVPILLLVLYFGLYKFVGEFGAGTLVDFIETEIFENILNPYLVKIVNGIIPWPVLRSLFVGEYGLVTLGLRYAVAIILPIVATFFLVFAVIEDTGYLPRLAMLIDRLFKRIGLSGRAVIPMVLGLGCDTMATMVTRTLPTKRERVIATFLLSLSIPCSAQLGVIMVLFHGKAVLMAVWLGIILTIFALAGYFTAKILPGESPVFFMEVPPLRLPKPYNVFIKTYSRMTWYFKEVFPLFILASALIWIGNLTGVFNLLIRIITIPVRMLGLPDKTAVSFLFGFFRRDYGAAGLYDMEKAGLFSGNQLLVAIVTMTLFLPCVAQFLINIKERGIKTGVGISVFIFFFAFIVGYLLNLSLSILGVAL